MGERGLKKVNTIILEIRDGLTLCAKSKVFFLLNLQDHQQFPLFHQIHL